MAARTSLTTLIAQIRLLISDRGTTPTFTDEEIQTFLDQRRRDVHSAPCDAAPYIAPTTGIITYKDFYTNGGNWEADATFTDAGHDPIVPDTLEYLPGHFGFTTGLGNPVLYITGRQFDVYGVAADILEAWAAMLKLDFDFTSAQRSFQRSQKIDAVMSVAKMHRAKAWINTSTIVRTDELSGQGF